MPYFRCNNRCPYCRSNVCKAYGIYEGKLKRIIRKSKIWIFLGRIFWESAMDVVVSNIMVWSSIDETHGQLSTERERKLSWILNRSETQSPMINHFNKNCTFHFNKQEFKNHCISIGTYILAWLNIDWIIFKFFSIIEFWSFKSRDSAREIKWQLI